jgi:hypothetical protein
MIGTLGQFVREIRDKLAGTGDPVPVSIQGTDVVINAEIDNEVEIKNDDGNPIPVSDAGGSLTVDSPELTSIDGKVPANLTVTSTRLLVDGSGVTQPISATALPLPTGAATAARQDTGNTSLGNIDVDLGAPADAAATTDTGTFGLIALVKRGLQNWTTLLGRVPANLTVTATRLLVDGSGVVQPTGVPVRTPTTTSITSGASSVTILAANANRKGISIANDSTSALRLSYATPASSANAFIVMQPGSFLWLDQQLIVGNIIYGIWESANGTAQVTEYI